MTYNIMAAKKDLDARHTTRGGATIRVETWSIRKTGEVVKYNLAYVNRAKQAADNGRIIGFDNSHSYPGFASEHHYHRMGKVFEAVGIATFDEALERFERYLVRVKRCYGREY